MARWYEAGEDWRTDARTDVVWAREQNERATLLVMVMAPSADCSWRGVEA
jgi:hypothetical protein